MSLRAGVIALLFVASGFSECACAAVFSEEAYTGTLFRIDLVALTATRIGDAGSYGGTAISAVAGLTYDSSGQLYAVAAIPTPLLMTVNPTNGLATVVGELSISQSDASLSDLAFTCDGNLWLISANSNRLWQINKSSAAATLVGSLGATITGIAVRGTSVYATGGDVTSQNHTLYSINTGTAAVTSIGAYGVSQWLSVLSPSFDSDGQLWAEISSVPVQPGNVTVPDWNQLATINRTTGAMTVLGDIIGPASLKGFAMRGLAIAPPNCTDSGGGGGIFLSEATVPSPGLSAFGMISMATLFALLGSFFSWRRVRTRVPVCSR